MQINEYAEIFKALAHPIRLKIACGLMKKQNCNVSTMCEKLEVAQPTVSQHLTILKNANVISGVRNGNRICYKVDNPKVIKLLKSIDVDFCK